MAAPPRGGGENPLRALAREGQSVWLDFMSRGFVTGGGLQRLVDGDGVTGVTINPTILEQAIGGSSDYDEPLRRHMEAHPRADAAALYEALAVEDARLACDVLRPVWEASRGEDGHVSLELSPGVAYDTEASLREARHLWALVDRPNLMLKVPATAEGVPAIEQLTFEGVNVNITLMFSLAHYEEVAQAYLRGLKRRAAEGRDLRVASVASFFVSRVDAAVDQALDGVGGADAEALRGRTGVANSKLAYHRFRELFHGPPFAALAGQGARPQRVLWASTGVKDPAYRDTMYVEELIAPETVNTMPPATMDAFRDHGEVRGATATQGLDEARHTLERLGRLGVDLDAITRKLQEEGVAKFAASYDRLLEVLEGKRRAVVATDTGKAAFRLGDHQRAVEARLDAWRGAQFAQRMWRKDPTLWAEPGTPEIVDRLGWLILPEVMEQQVADLRAFADEVRAEGVRHVVLLGMGGSSLAPEVFQRTFGNAPGFPELLVLDSTHPEAVRAVTERVDPRAALFVVSSKSGGTVETLSGFRHFWRATSEALGPDGDPGPRFVAITDSGSGLEKLAEERGFRQVFLAPSDVGGRYSALTAFGLVPAALIGVDVGRLLDRAWRMEEAHAFEVEGVERPGLMLGAALGEAALAGRDKVTFLTSPRLAAFPDWAEQLLAESTGKDGRGLVPVVGDPRVGGAADDRAAGDRVFVALRLEGDDNALLDETLHGLDEAGAPAVRIALRDLHDLGAELYRWEVATAAAGAVLRVHPFDQPDVEVAKRLAKEALAAARPGPPEAARDAPVVRADDAARLREALQEWRSGPDRSSPPGPGAYVAVQAFLAPTDPAVARGLAEVREALAARGPEAITTGWGPRFLHSTGQLHKGGPAAGWFLQLVDDARTRDGEDLPIPETEHTFGALLQAQAWGDLGALRQRGRRVLRVELGRDAGEGLRRVAEALAGLRASTPTGGR